MATTKITKRDVIGQMLADEVISANKVWAEYLTHELELLDNRKNSTSKAKKKKSKEAFEFVAKVFDLLDKPMTCTQIAKAMDTSSQRVCGLLSPYTDTSKKFEGVAVFTTTTEGKTTLYSKVEGAVLPPLETEETETTDEVEGE